MKKTSVFSLFVLSNATCANYKFVLRSSWIIALQADPNPGEATLITKIVPNTQIFAHGLGLPPCSVLTDNQYVVVLSAHVDSVWGCVSRGRPLCCWDGSWKHCWAARSPPTGKSMTKKCLNIKKNKANKHTCSEKWNSPAVIWGNDKWSFQKYNYTL